MPKRNHTTSQALQEGIDRDQYGLLGSGNPDWPLVDGRRKEPTSPLDDPDTAEEASYNEMGA
jgi:hypothetical protein